MSLQKTNRDNGDSMKKILIAGIGGASLGTEIHKSLLLSGKYVVYGCDIERLAYGHFVESFEKTFIVNRSVYVKEVIDICAHNGISYIIPGAEEPMVLLNSAMNELDSAGISLIGNSPEVVDVFSNKESTFKTLSGLGFAVPKTLKYAKTSDLEHMPYPAIIKPSKGSGGSSFVFFANCKKEAQIYVDYLQSNDKEPLVQEYIPEDEGEYTVGVLNSPSGDLIGSIALKREFPNKLSISSKLKNGMISSGYTQGLIGKFPHIEGTAEKISLAINSKGPINVQGRVRNGVFVPFEINPRFSSSTYFRALAGFNEIDLLIEHMETGKCVLQENLRYGYYLRSFTEVYVKKELIHID